MVTTTAAVPVTPTARGGGESPLMLHKLAGDSLELVLRAMRDLACDDAKQPRYPGPNPVSLDTSHFPQLRGEPYYICEKTDGLRFAMVCCTLPAPEHLRNTRDTINVCVLVDRSLAAFLLPLRGLPKAMYQGTLLDGEVAYNKESKAWDYLVFDAVCVSGVPVLNGTLHARMSAVHRVLRLYRHHADGDAVRVAPKTFISCSKLGEYTRHLESARRRYDVDGLVLTPATPPVVYGRHMGLFKLKTKHTVDFLVGSDGHSLNVYDHERHSHVPVGSLYPWHTVPPGSVAECVLTDPNNTHWDLVMIRTDKTTANDTYTFKKTMLNMREKLTLDNLKPLFPNLEA